VLIVTVVLTNTSRYASDVQNGEEEDATVTPTMRDCIEKTCWGLKSEFSAYDNNLTALTRSRQLGEGYRERSRPMRFDFGIRAEGDQGSIQAVADWVRPALRQMNGEPARWFAYELDINDLDDEWETLKPSDHIQGQDHIGFMAIYPGSRLAGEFVISGEGYSIAPFRLAQLIAKKWGSSGFAVGRNSRLVTIRDYA
jgi:hypothetical protein